MQLPSSWSAASHCIPSTTISAPAWPTADIHLTPDEHPVFGGQPWSLQYDGCGAPAKHLTLPTAFLAATNETNNATKAEKFAMEWARLKFGVFPESGFSGDNLYPESFTEGLETLQNSGCSQKVQVRKEIIYFKLRYFSSFLYSHSCFIFSYFQTKLTIPNLIKEKCF